MMKHWNLFYSEGNECFKLYYRERDNMLHREGYLEGKKKKKRKSQLLNILIEGPPGWVNNLFIKSAISSSRIHLCLPQPKAAFCPVCPLQPGKTDSQGQEFCPTYLTHRLWISLFLTISTDWSVEVSLSPGRQVRHGPFVGLSYRRKFHTLTVHYFLLTKM